MSASNIAKFAENFFQLESGQVPYYMKQIFVNIQIETDNASLPCVNLADIITFYLPFCWRAAVNILTF